VGQTFLIPPSVGFPCPRRPLISARIALTGLLAAGLVHGAENKTAKPLAAEELFRSPAFAHAALSPDGHYLAAIASTEADRRNLAFIDLRDYTPSTLLGKENFDISSFTWLDDERVLFTIARDKLYSWGLYTAKVSELERHYPINRYDLMQVIGVPRARPNRVLVWILRAAEDVNRRTGDLVELDAGQPARAFDPNRRDTAFLRSYTPPPRSGTVTRWIPNRDGDLALCATMRGGKFFLHRYVRSSDSWRTVALGPKTTPVELDPDERFLWVVRYDAETGGELRRFNLDTGELGPPVLGDRDYDLAGSELHFSARTRALLGVSYDRDRPVTHWFSKAHAAYQAAVDRHHPGMSNRFAGQDSGERHLLFHLTGAQQPGAYAVLDLDEKALHLVADSAPWLKDRPLLATQTVRYATRDGAMLDACLTVPPGASAQHQRPMVVLPHGGPWVRDTVRFDPVVQFLASRGYLVLQPNYRGSSGYSPALSRDHRFDFRRMHDDVTDATKFAIAGGLVDPKRIGIMGASFGGYLAVSGVAFEPDLYRCAVTECGVFDWERQVDSKEDDSRPGEYEFLEDGLEKRADAKANFVQISPLAHADAIKVPVLIAHGTEDNIVNVAQSKRLAAALKQRGVPHETYFRAVEGHGFYNYKNRVGFYRRVEAFLAANLGGETLTKGK
jgi:dipeptidyl aminopeptidase/acylaminoacyl peptidase